MGCLFVLLALIAPRVVIAVLWLFTDYLGHAYDTFLWPLLGFFFFPYTTLAYAVAINTAGSLRAGWVVLIILAVLADLGSMGAGERKRREQSA